MTYGRFRTIDLGDLHWNREVQPDVPDKPIGTVDLYLTSHHGLDQSDSPAFVHGAAAARGHHEQRHAQRRAGPDVYETLESSPGLEDLLAAALVVIRRLSTTRPAASSRTWKTQQPHRRLWRTRRRPPPARLVPSARGGAGAAPEPEEPGRPSGRRGGPGRGGAGRSLAIRRTSPRTGSRSRRRPTAHFTVTNARNGFSKTYKPTLRTGDWRTKQGQNW